MKNIQNIASALCIASALFLISGCNLFDDEAADKSWSISGRVVSSGNSGVEGVTLVLESSGSDGKAVRRSAKTDLNGKYVLEKVENGSYILTPFAADFGFYPDYKEITVNSANASIGAFTGYSQGGGNSTDGYSVSGMVKDGVGRGLAGINVALSGDDLMRYTSTDESGAFVFERLQAGSYQVLPSGEGYRFVPANKTVYVRSYNLTLDPFSAEFSSVVLPGEIRYDHDYYPLSHDAAWSYRISENVNGADNVTMKTFRIEGRVQVRGEDYYVLRDSYDYPLSFVRVAGDSVYMFHDIMSPGEIPFEGDAALREAQKAQFDDDDENPFLYAWPVYPLEAAADDVYLLFTHETSQIGAYFHWNWVGAYFGEEPVTVGAGTFAKSKKYELVFDAYGYGGGTGTRQIHRKTVWLGYRAGMIKSHETWLDDDVLVRERTMELIGYSIP